jgi:hypothetical protein
MTWPEVCAAADRREVVVTLEGYLLSSKDRKFEERQAKERYGVSVAQAIARGKEVPLAVRQEYERQILANGLSPAEAQRCAYNGYEGLIQPTPAAIRPLNAKGKPFTWSYTALSNFEGCPLRYAREKFYCDLPFIESEAIIFGNRVHTACEQYLKGQKVAEPTLLIPVAPYLKAFNSQKAAGAIVSAELELALNESMQPVSWFAKDAWFRGKFDVLIEKASTLGYYDWKTGGKVKDDQDQLKICCAALSIVKPEIETFTPKLIWTKHATITGIKDESLTRGAAGAIWDDTLTRVERMRQAWVTDTFPARPSGLCPWCGKYDSCPYARRR